MGGSCEASVWVEAQIIECALWMCCAVATDRLRARVRRAHCEGLKESMGVDNALLALGRMALGDESKARSKAC